MGWGRRMGQKWVRKSAGHLKFRLKLLDFLCSVLFSPKNFLFLPVSTKKICVRQRLCEYTKCMSGPALNGSIFGGDPSPWGLEKSLGGSIWNHRFRCSTHTQRFWGWVVGHFQQKFWLGRTPATECLFNPNSPCGMTPALNISPLMVRSALDVLISRPGTNDC